MPTTTDLVYAAIEKNPTDFASTFDELIKAKAFDAIQAKKIELAQSVYNSKSSDDGEEINTDDDIDIDIDDTDLDASLDDVDVGGDNYDTEGNGTDGE